MTILVDRYELIDKVGEGGMGVVWRAHDTRLERDVAIKLLRSFVATEPERQRRLAREARTLAALSNDHIVRVYDYVEADENAFLVMEFVDGCNLAVATFDRLPLPWHEAATYALPVCEGLAYAHAKGVVHRDLTPANILIEAETGRVVTTDFGLARIARSAGSLTTIGFLAGTPEYWSPELALGRETGRPADMYALGCIVYLLLSGHLPFEGEDRLALGLRRAHEDPPSLGERARRVPEGAVALVDALLSRDPSRRPDARTALSVIAEAAAGRKPRGAARATTARVPATNARTVVLRADGPTQVLPAASTVRLSLNPRVRRRRRRLVMTIVAAAVAAVVGGVVAAELQARGVRAPNVVQLREQDARARILDTAPYANVSVVRVYSTRLAPGRVIGQRPAPEARIRHGSDVTLTVSKGSPFALVPAISVGTAPAAARAQLARSGFNGRYLFTPSWSVRKGRVVELRPSAGTRLRRPATVRIVIASGYPRAVVPDVQDVALESARGQLEAKHLGYQVVYRLSETSSPGRVVAQKPPPGTTVYSGTRVRLVVTRTRGWQRVLADSGRGSYLSAPFTVPGRWRIRYRLDGGGSFAGVLTQFAWARADALFSDGGFVADTAGVQQVYDVPDGAGTYRLSVRPYSSQTAWYVEVEAFE
jgi:serine/threonine-protein kinase